MKEKPFVIYQDNANNKLLIEGRQLAVRNAQGKLVDVNNARRFLRRVEVRKALSSTLPTTYRLKYMQPKKRK